MFCILKYISISCDLCVKNDPMNAENGTETFEAFLTIMLLCSWHGVQFTFLLLYFLLYVLILLPSVCEMRKVDS